MSDDHYCWRDHSVPRGRWRADLGIAALFFVILAASGGPDDAAVDQSRRTADMRSPGPAHGACHTPHHQPLTWEI
jgi:hypothetical protein